MTDIIKKEKHKNVGPKWKPEYPQMLRDHLAEGYSIAGFYGKIKVSRDTIYEWFKKYPEFAQAKAEGESLAVDWFEKRLKIKLLGKKIDGVDPKLIDTACLIFALKTRFHRIYGDQSKVEHTVKTIEDLVKEKKKEVIE